MTPPPGRIHPGDAAGVARREVVLDLSRLISRVLHATPTGVDRVEMAYARGLLATIPDRLSFSALHPCGLYGRLDRQAVITFLDETEVRWDENHRPGRWSRRLSAARACLALRPHRVPPLPPGASRVYVQSSPHHLERGDRVAAILRREQARLVGLVHDLIPIEYPEYARPNGAALHQARMATLADHAAGLITNSDATRVSLRRHLERSGHQPIIDVAHLGTHPVPPPPALEPGAADPYFICVGTIEPRKNHLLLLNLWRRLVEDGGPVPRLVLVGRRGWENEQVIDMLERCPALAAHVDEHAGLPDRAMAQLIGQARALLLPSFAEGFGMPVTEALGAGVPVLCSDLPALREAGGEVPDYLDPLDGVAWIRSVREYAKADSSRRTAQLERLSRWKPPAWSDHIAILLDLIERV
ncbi:glycosyltransferase family 4 protein [Sphingomonas solaris]|uniref:Glycosyltransferase family 4 protein n=1 Tax=Alterirhizorhabdus solaris TaxID=2529389 RepID=A0A558R1W2_9SPHN|nr:glycosyltransferase family 1 protein [Sphingomonas solaris]TVV73376.1 glycosyltransferase family 4 protein [Sphingomonas solaris]